MRKDRHPFNCSLAGCTSTFRVAVLCVAAVLMINVGALGQAADPEEPPPTARTHPNDPTIWNVEAMMEEAVEQIARRYNLNKAQENYTRLLLVDKVRKFLDVYEDDVRLLLKESIMFRLDPQSATPEALQDWAERAEPVYAAARDAILEGNREWGAILTPEQKVVHDKDLEEMDVNFGRVGRVLEGMKKGEGLAAWRGAVSSGQTGKTAGQVSSDPSGSVVENRLMEDNWMTYVERFIEAYQLDEKQQNAARASIHKDARTRAQTVRDKTKAELEKIEAAFESLPDDPKAARQRRDDLNKRKANLEKPVRTIFIEMNGRLENLPTAAQRKKADAKKKEELERMYEDLAGLSSAKRKAVTGTKTRPDVKPTSTQPVTTQPVTTRPTGKAPAKAPAESPVPKSEVKSKKGDDAKSTKVRATDSDKGSRVKKEPTESPEPTTPETDNTESSAPATS